MVDEIVLATFWANLTEWVPVESYGEVYRERFTSAALAGVSPRMPFRFKVVRDEWRKGEDGVDERTIQEVTIIDG